jgi:hypothetical protein
MMLKRLTTVFVEREEMVRGESRASEPKGHTAATREQLDVQVAVLDELSRLVIRKTPPVDRSRPLGRGVMLAG